MAPVLAVVRPDFVLRLNEKEVSRVFEAPLAFLMDARNHERRSIVWRGRTRQFYAMPYDGYNIWGATAAILRNLYVRLYHGALFEG